MVPVEYDEAARLYPGRLKVAALAVLEEKPDQFRVIHDGTNTIHLNHHIRVRDHEEFPCVGDFCGALRADALANGAGGFFGLVFDISKAHRRVCVSRADWGLMGCALDKEPRDNKGSWKVHLNTVGTYGIGSASFWWGKLGGLLARLCYAAVGKTLRWLFRFADDYVAVVKAPGLWRPLLTLLIFLEMLSVSSEWRKVMGGCQVDWIGFRINLD